MEFDRPGFDREVGLRLQLIRKRRGVTQAQLAKEIGVPRATYANLESGRQRIPVDILWRAAVKLNVSISSLVPEPTNRQPTNESLFSSVHTLGANAASPASHTTLNAGSLPVHTFVFGGTSSVSASLPMTDGQPVVSALPGELPYQWTSMSDEE
jgi:transcriptional regulator with XRE-family HTH domain